MDQKQASELFAWTRSYAQHRSLAMFLCLVAIGIIIAGLSGFSHLARQAMRAGDTGLAYFYGGVVGLFILANIWLAVPQWGGRTLRRWAARIYGEEGEAALEPELTPGQKASGWIVLIIFAVWIQVMVWGNFKLSPAMLQPVSALGLVPFLVFIVWRSKGAIGRLLYVWPALYTIHAVLIVAGAPIVFTGKLNYLNMAIPTLGYGLLTALAAHAWSRYALRRARRAAR